MRGRQPCPRPRDASEFLQLFAVISRIPEPWMPSTSMHASKAPPPLPRLVLAMAVPTPREALIECAATCALGPCSHCTCSRRRSSVLTAPLPINGQASRGHAVYTWASNVIGHPQRDGKQEQGANMCWRSTVGCNVMDCL